MIWFAEGSSQGNQAECRADNASDVAKLPDFAERNHLKPGSTCLIIDTSEVYMMDSQGNWKPL